MSFRTNCSSIFLALILIKIFLSSSPCLCHEQNNLQYKDTSFLLPRKLLFSLSSMVVSVFPADSSKNTSSAAMKEPKKALEPSLRRAPSSVPNPTQNK
ncbi:hypothetical protein F8388_016068 [Cannabis sativa]|uniref:Uncharacterized protein n=1 Tax=Cannabis sativa TaxID=3483 RepID=A0A7J6I5K1_CANSA|nr:hypothetical protein F8388_016068 [Cannabis sativa]KAF4402485.1 hypothetical protein G4B88_012270 [Cannabis sativa]